MSEWDWKGKIDDGISLTFSFFLVLSGRGGSSPSNCIALCVSGVAPYPFLEDIPTLRGIPFREAFMIKPYRCGHVQSYAHCNAQQNTHQLSRWWLWYGDGLVDSEGCKAPATMNVANPESLVTDDVKITIKFCGGNLSESSSSHQNGKIQMKIVCSSTAGPLGKENIMEKQKKKK